jgi:hypothetical protein
MTDSGQKPLIPSPADIRQRLAENIEDAKLLRRQLKISEQAAAEAYRRRNRDVTRFRKEGGS